MITNELLTFIKEQISKGSAEEEITKMLLSDGGWDEHDVKEAFQSIGIYSSTYQNAVEKAFQKAEESQNSLAAVYAAKDTSAQKDAGSTPTIIKQVTPIINTKDIETELDKKEIITDMHSGLTASLMPSFVATHTIQQPVTTVEKRPEIHFTPLPPLQKQNVQMPSVSSGVSVKISSSPRQSISATSPLPPIQEIAPGSLVSRPKSLATGNMPPKLEQTPVLANIMNRPNITYALDTKPIILKPKRRILRNILLIIFILFILGGGFIFAYIAEFIPMKISQLEILSDRVSVMIGAKADNIQKGDAHTADIETNTKNLPNDQSELSNITEKSIYFADQVRIILPSGTVTSVTSTAANIAAELRGRVSSCRYADINECVLVIQVKKDGDIDKVIKELLTDKRIKGVEKVLLP